MWNFSTFLILFNLFCLTFFCFAQPLQIIRWWCCNRIYRTICFVFNLIIHCEATVLHTLDLTWTRISNRIVCANAIAAIAGTTKFKQTQRWMGSIRKAKRSNYICGCPIFSDTSAKKKKTQREKKIAVLLIIDALHAIVRVSVHPPIPTEAQAIVQQSCQHIFHYWQFLEQIHSFYSKKKERMNEAMNRN